MVKQLQVNLDICGVDRGAHGAKKERPEACKQNRWGRECYTVHRY